MKLFIFSFSGSTMKAWGQNQQPKRKMFEGFLIGTSWGEMSGAEALTWVLKMNNLENVGKFEILSYKETPKGVYCAFDPSDELEKALEKNGPALKAGICTFVVHKRVVKHGAPSAKLDKNGAMYH